MAGQTYPTATIVYPSMATSSSAAQGPIDHPSVATGGGSRIGTVVLFGALGVAGYFVYRHFKNKSKGK